MFNVDLPDDFGRTQQWAWPEKRDGADWLAVGRHRIYLPNLIRLEITDTTVGIYYKNGPMTFPHVIYVTEEEAAQFTALGSVP